MDTFLRARHDCLRGIELGLFSCVLAMVSGLGGSAHDVIELPGNVSWRSGHAYQMIAKLERA
jgi:hypothetical protein